MARRPSLPRLPLPRGAAKFLLIANLVVASADATTTAGALLASLRMLPASSRANRPEQPGHSIVLARLFSISGN